MSEFSEMFESDPRSYALDLITDGVCDTEYLLGALLKAMSVDEVREMLDSNELSPRFIEPDFVEEI